MADPLCHKTVFLLERSITMERPCGHSFEMDSLNKSRGGGLIPLPALTKSVWTCALEAAVEYCRIVWDVYPSGRLVRLLLSGEQVIPVNSWNQQDQHLPQLMAQLAATAPGARAAADAEAALRAGLAAAVGALGEPSEAQRSEVAEAAPQLNAGRVVVVTQLREEAALTRLQQALLEALPQHNRAAAAAAGAASSAGAGPLTVHSCELVVVSAHPDTEPAAVVRPSESLSATVTGSVVTAAAGTELAPAMMNLVLAHHQLASTTVTGIPMKEEQNSGSSANYDVELLHAARAYEALLQTGGEQAHLRTRRPGCDYATITLKWCTPRTSSAELHQCTTACRVTPVDVNSRPSSCLTNFLLNGRAVMLEMPRKQGGKFVSHMLAAHGGEIFMHALGGGRSVLEDPPSISEGAGGRVTDYRIPELGHLISSNRLVPCGTAQAGDAAPLQAALEKLCRQTRVWPLTLSESALAALPGLDTLTTLLSQDSLTTDQQLQCKQLVYALVGMESRHEPLASGGRGRAGRREEQYSAVWAQLESLVRAHCRSDSHRAVLECVTECRAQAAGGTAPAAPAERLGLEQAMEELDRTALESPLSPPPPAKRWRPAARQASQPRQTLLTLWSQRVDADNALKRLEFSGRLNSDAGTVKLYAHLDKGGENDPPKRK